MLVLLHGKTRKGKDIIAQHGDKWEFIKHGKDRQILVGSGREMRWVAIDGDRDFDVTVPDSVRLEATR